MTKMNEMNKVNKAKDVLKPTRFINIINDAIDAENYIKERSAAVESIS